MKLNRTIKSRFRKSGPESLLRTSMMLEYRQTLKESVVEVFQNVTFH